MDISDIPTQPLSAASQWPVVLVIDGFAERRRMVRQMLTLARYDVCAFSRPQEALVMQPAWNGKGENGKKEHSKEEHKKGESEQTARIQLGKHLHALVLGLVTPGDRAILHRLLASSRDWRGRQLAVVPLDSAFPSANDQGRLVFVLNIQGYGILLETLWQL